MTVAKNEWNPRFAAYCKNVGCAPEQVNNKTMPGWSIAFAEWLRARLTEFKTIQPEAFYWGMYETTLIDHKAFDAWLVTKTNP